MVWAIKINIDDFHLPKLFSNKASSKYFICCLKSWKTPIWRWYWRENLRTPKCGVDASPYHHYWPPCGLKPPPQMPHLVQTSFRNNIFSIIGHRDHFYQSSLGKWIRRFISMPATRETLMTEVGGGDEVFNPADVLLVSVPSSLTLSPQPVRFPAKSYSLFAETSLAWKLVPVYLWERVGLSQSVKAFLMQTPPFKLVSSDQSIWSLKKFPDKSPKKGQISVLILTIPCNNSDKFVHSCRIHVIKQ